MKTDFYLDGFTSVGSAYIHWCSSIEIWEGLDFYECLEDMTEDNFYLILV